MVDYPQGDDAADSDRIARDRTGTGEAGGETPRQPESDCIACTEAYEVDGGVVLFDADNPMAWIETDSSVLVERMA